MLDSRFPETMGANDALNLRSSFGGESNCMDKLKIDYTVL